MKPVTLSKFDPCRIVTGTRQIGGPSVWIILFEPVEVEASNPDYVLELSEFYCNSYCYTSDGRAKCYLDRRSNWSRFLRRTLFLKATAEIGKLDPSIGLPTYVFYEFTENGSLASPQQYGLELPDDFTYWDDEIPKLYEEWQQSQPQKTV